MNNRALIVLLVAVGLLSASCAQSVSSGGEYGKLTVSFGGARAFETGWPGGTIPTFSSVTIKVSAADMETVTVTSGAADSLTVKVPAGKDRLVAINAVPASASGMPFFAKAFGGSALVDVAEGEQKAVTIKLQLSESKLVLPSYDSGDENIYYADSIAGSPVLSAIPLAYLGVNMDPTLDTYGRLYYIEGSDNSVYRATTNSDGTEYLSTISGYGSTTYSPSKHRFYYSYDGTFYFADMTTSGPSVVSVGAVSGYTLNSVMAADESFLYVDGTNDGTGEGVILKLAVSDDGTASLAAVAAHYAIALAVMDDYTLGVTDMQVQDDVLYIAGRSVSANMDSNYAFSRGKVVALSATTLTKLWEAGWSGDANNFPTSPTTQFFGPQRFVGIAPKKLYLIDEGFAYDGGHYSTGLYTTVSRVVELDAEQNAITEIGMNGVLRYLDTTDYEATYVC